MNGQDLEIFKPLKGGELTKKCRELADKEVTGEVKKLDERTVTVGIKRGNYEFYMAEKKAKVAKYVAEHGVTASLQHFKQSGEFSNFKESTVHGWVKYYRNELVAAGMNLTGGNELPGKK